MAARPRALFAVITVDPNPVLWRSYDFPVSAYTITLVSRDVEPATSLDPGAEPTSTDNDGACSR